jgi:hypothetical protein
VRVPWPIVVLLCVVIPGGIWWYGARGKDFVTPPTEQRLAERRQELGEMPPPVAPQPIEKPAAPEVPPPPPEPPIEAGDVATAPALNAYAAEAKTKGADHLLKLAAKLEEHGATARALLACERVLDLAKGDPVQSAAALKAIKRLRPNVPPWNVDPEGTQPLVLHLGASPAMAAKLKPALESVPRMIERASSGIVAVTTELAVGKKPAGGAEATPVALWLTGGAAGTPSTEVASFTVVSPEALEKEMLSAVFELVRARVSRSAAFGAPLAIGVDESPADALATHLTRLVWQEFAKGMNTVPPALATAPPATPAKPDPVKPAAKKPAKPVAPAKPPVAKPVAKPPVAKPVAPPAAKPVPKRPARPAKPVNDAYQE